MLKPLDVSEGPAAHPVPEAKRYSHIVECEMRLASGARLRCMLERFRFYRPWTAVVAASFSLMCEARVCALLGIMNIVMLGVCPEPEKENRKKKGT